MTLAMSCDSCGQSIAYEYGTGDRSGLCWREACRRARAERARAAAERADRVDPLSVRARCPYSGKEMRFELARQDGRTYHRLLIGESGGGSLTTERHAIETVNWWKLKGWTA